MLEIAIAIAVIGSAIAGLWDLKTTEVPDEIPILMAASGLFIWFISALGTGNFSPFILSLLMGTAILAIGWILYKHGKWGGADAWIFAALLYLVPVYNNKIFLLDYLPNLLWVSTLFSIIYAFALGIINRYAFGYFLKDINENVALVVGLPLAVSALLSSAYILLPGAPSFPAVNIFILLLLLMVFWRYAKIIETRVFIKRIPVKNLRAGDVLYSMIWRGLTYEEVAKIKKTKKFVTVKEGMRFVPVFFLALVVTLLYGNLLFWFV